MFLVKNAHPKKKGVKNRLEHTKGGTANKVEKPTSGRGLKCLKERGKLGSCEDRRIGRGRRRECGRRYGPGKHSFIMGT